MTDLTQTGFSSFSGSHLPENMSGMAEPELAQWAEREAMRANSDTALVRLGAVLFWAVVSALLLARIFLFDPNTLRPAVVSLQTASSAFHLTSNAKP